MSTGLTLLVLYLVGGSATAVDAYRSTTSEESKALFRRVAKAAAPEITDGEIKNHWAIPTAVVLAAVFWPILVPIRVFSWLQRMS